MTETPNGENVFPCFPHNTYIYNEQAKVRKASESFELGNLHYILLCIITKRNGHNNITSNDEKNIMCFVRT